MGKRGRKPKIDGQDILELLHELGGRATTRDIADKLGVCEETVRRHLKTVNRSHKIIPIPGKGQYLYNDGEEGSVESLRVSVKWVASVITSMSSIAATQVDILLLPETRQLIKQLPFEEKQSLSSNLGKIKQIADQSVVDEMIGNVEQPSFPELLVG